MLRDLRYLIFVEGNCSSRRDSSFPVVWVHGRSQDNRNWRRFEDAIGLQETILHGVTGSRKAVVLLHIGNSWWRRCGVQTGQIRWSSQDPDKDKGMVHSNGLVDIEDRGFAGCPSQKKFHSTADQCFASADSFKIRWLNKHTSTRCNGRSSWVDKIQFMHLSILPLEQSLHFIIPSTFPHFEQWVLPRKSPRPSCRKVSSKNLVLNSSHSFSRSYSPV